MESAKGASQSIESSRNPDSYHRSYFASQQIRPSPINSTFPSYFHTRNCLLLHKKAMMVTATGEDSLPTQKTEGFLPNLLLLQVSSHPPCRSRVLSCFLQDVLSGFVSWADRAAQIPHLLLNKAAKEDVSGKSYFGSQVDHAAI